MLIVICPPNAPQYCSRQLTYSAQKNKLFAPNVASISPKITKIQNLSISIYMYYHWTCITPTIIHWCRKKLSHIYRIKYSACFRAESFFY